LFQCIQLLADSLLALFGNGLGLGLFPRQLLGDLAADGFCLGALALHQFVHAATQILLHDDLALHTFTPGFTSQARRSLLASGNPLPVARQGLHGNEFAFGTNAARATDTGFATIAATGVYTHPIPQAAAEAAFRQQGIEHPHMATVAAVAAIATLSTVTALGRAAGVIGATGLPG